MPSDSKLNAGMQVLTRTTSLHHEDWVRLVEARQELILTQKHGISFMSLSDLLLPVSDGSPRPQRRIGDMTNRKDLNKIQGIFHVIETKDISHKKIWGMTRNGTWLYAMVYTTSRIKSTYLAEFLVMTFDNDSEVMMKACRITPEEVWKKLGSFIKDVAERRQKLLEEITHLRDIVIAEESALRFVPPPSLF